MTESGERATTSHEPQQPRPRSIGAGTMFWVCFALTALSAVVSAGFSLSALFGPLGSDIYVQYAASRSVALVLAVASVAFLRHRLLAIVFAFTMTVVQALDAFAGAGAEDAAKTWGPVGLAIATLVVGVLLARSRPAR